MYKSLIIDDEKPVQIAISKLGKWHHYNIKIPETAANGEQGLKIMREIHPSVVFVDMNMPIMDGCSFLNIASKEFPDCKFIVVSGYDSFSYAHQALRCGAIDYLLKPIEEKSLNEYHRKGSPPNQSGWKFIRQYKYAGRTFSK